MTLRKLTNVTIRGNRVEAILHTGIFLRRKIMVYKIPFTNRWYSALTDPYDEYYLFSDKQNKKLEKLYNRSAYD